MPPFSYFRNQHRRSDSTPNSDSPRSPQWKSPSIPFSGSGSGAAIPSNSPSSFRASAISSPANESPVSPSPPVLPPIPRVASQHGQDKSKTHAVSKSESGFPTETFHQDRSAEAPLTISPRINTPPPILSPVPRIMSRRLPGQPSLKIRTTDAKAETSYRWSQQPISQSEYIQQPQTIPPGSRSSGIPVESFQRPANDVPTDRSGPAQDYAQRPTTPPISQSSNELYPPENTSSRREPSPSSSFSSFRKSISSANVINDTSPPSSKAAQQSYPANTKASKPRMNRLNPVSLLRKRRTGQNVEISSEGTIMAYRNLDVPAMSLPEDYDPRIKGKGVHDFSAPRPKRQHSTNEAEPLPRKLSSEVSPVEDNRRRSVIPAPLTNTETSAFAEARNSKVLEQPRLTAFREDFDNDAEENANSVAVNRESLANSMFLARMSRQLDFDSADFATTNVDTISESQQQQPASAAGERTSKSTVGAPSFRISSDRSTARSSISNDTKATSPPGSPPTNIARSSLTLEPPFQPEVRPKQLSSNASRSSRFSFQLNGEATSEQEKALEEKGKEKAAKARQLSSDVEDDYDSDDSNYGEFDDEPYEEEIPMVNVVDDDDLDAPSTQAYLAQYSNVVLEGGSDQVDESEVQTEPHANQSDLGQQSDTGLRQETMTSDGSVDSMYYDDGMIDEPSPNGNREFDETCFDSPVDMQKDPPFPSEIQRDTTLVSGSHNETIPPGSPGAYHDALVSATERAEANGRFHRQPSMHTSISDLEHDGGFQAARLELVAVDWSQTLDDEEDPDGLDDDQMVAAANAEVLASEDSEFYGREFGFYGGAPGSGAEMYNGGFFGPGADDLKRSASGMNALREPNLTPITERSEFSTRNSFISLHGYGSNQSAPNSAVSRNEMSLPSPVLGLKELAASMSMDEESMTLSDLIRLRRETFGAGGGNASHSASTSYSNASPLYMIGPGSVPTVPEEYQELRPQSWSSEENGNDEQYTETSDSNTTHRLSLSGYSSTEMTPRPHSSFPKQEPGNQPSSAVRAESPFSTPNTAFLTSSRSPTNSQGQPSSPSSPYTAPGSPIASHSAPTSPIAMPMPSPSLMNKFANRPPASSATYAERHRQRNSAGNASTTGSGDSVAYVMEDSKWYLERRRRLSSGELVVVGREMVEGGRI